MASTGSCAVSERTSRWAFFSVSALLVFASAATTVVGWSSRSAMGEIPMSGGWAMPAAWLPTCGKTWLHGALTFLGMWVMMTAAMMSPSLAPALWRYHQAARLTGKMRVAGATTLVGAGYFFVWSAVGLVVFPLRAALAYLVLHHPAMSRAVPSAAGLMVLAAGSLQFTAWKAHHLACCRKTPATDAITPGRAWRQGLRLGLNCSCCCAGLTAILLVAGLMDLRAMTIVTAAVTLERLAPAGERFAQAIGALLVITGLFIIIRAAGLS